MNKFFKWVSSVLVTIILCFSLSLLALASDEPTIKQSESAISVSENHSLEATDESPSDTIVEETASSISPQVMEERQETPEKKTSSNMPLYFGAGISVLVFLGVIIFCKIKGNK